MKWNNLIKSALMNLVSVKNIPFFLVFYIFATPLLNLHRVTDLLPMLQIIPHNAYNPGLIGIDPIIAMTSTIISYGAIITLILLSINLVAQAGYIRHISKKESTTKQCFKTGVLKFKKIFGIITIITIAIFMLVIVPLIAMNSLAPKDASRIDADDEKITDNDISQIFNTHQKKQDEEKMIFLNTYGATLISTVSGFGKPFIVTNGEFKDYCITGITNCFSSISNYGIGIQIIPIIANIIIAILTLFVLQIIILKNKGVIDSIKENILFVKNNLDEVLILYMISLLSFLVFSLFGTIVTSIISSYFGLISIIAYQMIQIIGFMFVISLQTEFYLNKIK